MNEINEQSRFDLARLRRYASPQNSNDQWYAVVINGLSGVDHTIQMAKSWPLVFEKHTEQLHGALSRLEK